MGGVTAEYLEKVVTKRASSCTLNSNAHFSLCNSSRPHWSVFPNICCTISGLLQHLGQMWTRGAVFQSVLKGREEKTKKKRRVWCTTVMMHIGIAKPLSDRQLPVKFILARGDSCWLLNCLWLGSHSTQHNYPSQSPPDSFRDAVWVKSWCWQLMMECCPFLQDLLMHCEAHTPANKSGLSELIVRFLWYRERELCASSDQQSFSVWLFYSKLVGIHCYAFPILHSSPSKFPALRHAEIRCSYQHT